MLQIKSCAKFEKLTEVKKNKLFKHVMIAQLTISHFNINEQVFSTLVVPKINAAVYLGCFHC